MMLKLYRELDKHDTATARVKRLNDERSILEDAVAQQRAEELRDVRRLRDEKSEAAQHDLLAHLVRRQEIAQQQQLQEERLALQIQKQKTEAIRATKIRQQLRESAPELRQLKVQLLHGRVAKEQYFQICEREALEEARKIEDNEVAGAEAIRIQEQEKLLKRLEDEQRFKAQLYYHQELDEQRRQQAELNEEAYAQTLREREQIDQMLEKICEEDLEREKKRIENLKRYQDQIAELQRQRDELSEQQKLQQMAEEYKVSNYREVQELRAQAEREKRKLEMQSKMKVQEELMGYLNSVYEKKASDETLRVELAIEEKEEMEDYLEREFYKTKGRMQAETAEVYDLQMWLKYQREELEKKEEELFKKYMLAKWYEDDQLAVLSDHKRRLKQQEHFRMAQALVEERRARVIDAREKEMADYNLLKEMEVRRRKLVEAERQLMLRENARDLLGFLPKGIIRDEDELDQLGEEFKQFYRKRTDDSDSA